MAASLRNRTAVAEWVLARQAEKGDRFRVAVIAAGDERADGMRFAVEDLLGAGAVIDALAVVGIDYCSPEAAVATAAFGALKRATGHLISASVSGQEVLAMGLRSDIDLAVRDRRVENGSRAAGQRVPRVTATRCDADGSRWCRPGIRSRRWEWDAPSAGCRKRASTRTTDNTQRDN